MSYSINVQYIQAYICDKINNFEPDPKHKGNDEHELDDFDKFMNKLVNDELQGIMCQVQRIKDLKRLIDEYEKARDELKKMIPDLCL